MGTLDAKDHKDATIQYVGDIPVDKELDRPMWGMENNKLPDHLVDADKADCTENIDCESTRSPLLFKSKAQKLSAYGVGAEHDNALELGKV